MASKHRKRRPKGGGGGVGEGGEVELTTASGNGFPRQSKASSRNNKRPRGISKNASTGWFSGSTLVQPQTWQAALVLSIAIVTALVWNRMDGAHSVDPSVEAFLHNICSMLHSPCHKALRASRRTQRAVRPIYKGETLLVIPRKYTLWDLDALRNSWIQEELFSARISGTSPLSSAAYLAAHLARLMYGRSETARQGDEDDPVLQDYLRSVLPRTMADFEFHPVVWSETELEELVGPYTSAFHHILANRWLINDEYKAFTKASTKFALEISFEQYQMARLNVITRSFGTGVLQPTESRHGHMSLEDETTKYQLATGIDLSRGCHAMVPVLDLYDHHPQPNVGFSYDFEQRVFVIKAVRTISAGTEIYDSYGKRTDSDLFAKYGFVNGDGSGYTEASLALFHRLDLNTYSREQRAQHDQVLRKQMLRYLQYDDGYESCVDKQSSDAKAWELKKLKYEFLLSIATIPKHWDIRLPPRDMTSFPASRSDVPITREVPFVDLRNIQLADGSLVFSTCRILTLTHFDYNGTATELLRNGKTQLNNFALPSTQDGLEFRTLMCVARMAQTALARFGRALEQQEDHVSYLNRMAFQSRNWTVAHVRLGEMQTLDAIKQIAFSAMRPFKDLIDTEPAYAMRDQACPALSVVPLYEEMDQQ